MPKQPPPPTPQSREERLAAALRQNLLRRKAQARAREAAANPASTAGEAPTVAQRPPRG